MSGKSRYNRGKHHQGRKGKAKQRYASMGARQPVVAETSGLTASTSVPAPAASMPTPLKPSEVIQHPYVASELRRIGLLAGIIIVILVVLALVLS